MHIRNLIGQFAVCSGFGKLAGAAGRRGTSGRREEPVTPPVAGVSMTNTRTIRCVSGGPWLKGNIYLLDNLFSLGRPTVRSEL